MRALRWRAAAVVTGVILAYLSWQAMGGGDHVIQIQFATVAEIVLGAEVVIDGEVVGTIERRGARTVNGFRVEPGEHSVELRMPGYGSRGATVDTYRGGGTAMLMADFSEGISADGEREALLVLY